MPLVHEEPAVVELEGWNGSLFHLSGLGAGTEGIYLGTDVEGIYDAPVSTIYNSHAFQTGSTYGGKRNLQRDLVFGLEVTDDNGLAWSFNDSEIRKAFSYDFDSKLWVTTATSRRYLKIRLKEQPQVKMRKDPRLIGTQKVLLTCVAADPWWYEEVDKTETFISTSDTRTEQGSGTGVYPINWGTVPISNPSDVPIWLKWVLQAPAKFVIPDFSFGDNRYKRSVIDADRKVVMPMLQPNEHVLVDTDEEAEQVRSSLDTAVYMRMNGVTFCYPIPAYTKRIMLPVGISRAPAGVGIQVRMPRPWSRPWGLE